MWSDFGGGVSEVVRFEEQNYQKTGFEYFARLCESFLKMESDCGIIFSKILQVFDA
jgi:hypothetical protein